MSLDFCWPDRYERLLYDADRCLLAKGGVRHSTIAWHGLGKVDLRCHPDPVLLPPCAPLFSMCAIMDWDMDASVCGSLGCRNVWICAARYWAKLACKSLTRLPGCMSIETFMQYQSWTAVDWWPAVVGGCFSCLPWVVVSLPCPGLVHGSFPQLVLHCL